MGRIVAIVGTAFNTRLLGNEQPGEVEVWGCAAAWRFLDRIDRQFEIHRLDILRANLRQKDWLEHIDFLQHTDAKVYMQEVSPAYPTSVRYPIEEMRAEFHNYLTSSAALMMALAIHEGVEEVRLLGIDMAVGEEYLVQKAGMEYLIGVAEGKGIKIVIPDISPLMRAPVYAYSEADEEEKLVRLYAERSKALDAEEARLERQIAMTRAKRSEVDFFIAIAKGITDPSALQAIADGMATIPWRLPTGLVGAQNGVAPAQAKELIPQG